MKRRDFLSRAGFGTYSIIITGAGLFALPDGQAPVDGIRKSFDRISPPPSLRKMADSEPRMTLVELECDLLVAGGGLAGVCAAISAARHGARVVLVQDRSRLGGNSSSEVKMHVVGANSHKGRPGWREGGLIEELRLEDAVRNPQRCFELWDLLLYDKVISESNITLLLETAVYAASTSQGIITEVLARCDRSEHLYKIKARLFCDSTGDSRLALEAGAEMRTGRESRAEFGESLAPEKADQETLGSSILFTARQYDRPMPFKPPSWARTITPAQLNHREITSWEYGYWWVEWGGDHDTIKDNERIRFELLSIVMGVWDHIKNSGRFPSASHWAMDWVGMMPGRRGSRRIVGDHLLTEKDLLSGEFFDAVSIGGWPMDDHPPGGFDRPDLPPNTVLKTPEVYSIPLRSLYSRNIANLLMAGRNISATHAAFTSTRVMATCAAVGQAVGTAAALCLQYRMAPRELQKDRQKVQELQQTLLRDDQTLRGLSHQDETDLARSAWVTSSGEEPGTPAAAVLDGISRDIPKSPAHPDGSIHQWSAFLGKDGAWIELAWKAPKRIQQVQITFDSGFARELTLSASNSINKGMIRGPQPETVRDYRLLTRASGEKEFKEILSVKGNYQRLRRHSFPPMDLSALRLHVLATNGDPQARVFEIRCYGPANIK